MKKPTISVGLLFTEEENLTPYNQLIYSYGFPRIIIPGERVGSLDAVIVPDNVGAYIGMACFAANRYQGIAQKILCPYAELFRLDDRGMNYYKEKQILVIGIGQGAIMLWNDLNYRCRIGTTIELIDPQDSELEIIKRAPNGSVLEFRRNNYLGVESLHSPTLRDELTHLKRLAVVDWASTQEEDNQTPINMGDLIRIPKIK